MKTKKKNKKKYPKTSADMEFKFLQYLTDNKVLLEIKLVDEIQFTGKIKWFSEWLMEIETEGKKIILNRLMMQHCSIPREVNISEKEIKKLKWLIIDDDTENILSNIVTPYELKQIKTLKNTTFSKENLINKLERFHFNKNKINTIFNKLKKVPTPKFKNKETDLINKFINEKSPLAFHMKNNIQIEGYLEWAGKLNYHIKNPDNNQAYSIYKNSVIYIEKTAFKTKEQKENKEKKKEKKRKSKKKRKKKK